MTVSSVNGTTGNNATTGTPGGFASLGQADFFKLLTVQMQQQDPFDPVDNKEMLAQMAQFSSLATSSDMSNTLNSIASKLDALIALQQGGGATGEESQT